MIGVDYGRGYERQCRVVDGLDHAVGDERPTEFDAVVQRHVDVAIDRVIPRRRHWRGMLAAEQEDAKSKREQAHFHSISVCSLMPSHQLQGRHPNLKRTQDVGALVGCMQ